jgi:hypothetical protein
VPELFGADSPVYIRKQDLSTRTLRELWLAVS